MADSMSSLVHQFLEHYSAPADKGRFFTQSQLFIAFRNYVARTNPCKCIYFIVNIAVVSKV